jgi:hypothetical protein
MLLLALKRQDLYKIFYLKTAKYGLDPIRMRIWIRNRNCNLNFSGVRTGIKSSVPQHWLEISVAGWRIRMFRCLIRFLIRHF